MAYENYRFVNWASYTPITGARLSQMSTNIEQVKEATDGSPQGILKYGSVSSNINIADQTRTTLVRLQDETGGGGSDNRVTADANRYVRLVLALPTIKVDSKGGEDMKYNVTFYQGADDDVSPTQLQNFIINPHLYGFYDVASNAATTTVDVRSTGNDVYFGAGTYSTIIDSGANGYTNQAFHVSIKRDPNSDVTNAPDYDILASADAPLEFYVEDVGGAI